MSCCVTLCWDVGWILRQGWGKEEEERVEVFCGVRPGDTPLARDCTLQDIPGFKRGFQLYIQVRTPPNMLRTMATRRFECELSCLSTAGGR